MSILGEGDGPSWPASLDTAELQVDYPNINKTLVDANLSNDILDTLVALQTELGINPAGSLVDLTTFLQTEHNDDGTHSDINAGDITADDIIAASIDIGTTIKFTSRVLTVDTGGGFNIILGSAPGDDFTIGSAFTVEGDTGNVGIGTAPDANVVLHVRENDAVDARLSLEATGTANDAVFQLLVRDGRGAQIDFGDESDSNIGRIRYNHSDNSMSFTTNNSIAITIDSAQQLGVGVVDPDTLVELFKVGTQLKLSGGDDDYATFAVAADGALTITTVDVDAANADIILTPDGKVNVTGNITATTATITNGLLIGNSASAVAGTMRWTGSDFEGYTGSIWSSLLGSGGFWLLSGSTIYSATDEKIATGGETSPLCAVGGIHIKTGDVGVISPNSTANDLIIENDVDCGITIYSSLLGSIYFGDVDNDNIGRIVYNHAADSMFFMTAGSTVMTFDNSQNIRFNGTNYASGGTLSTDGSGNVTTASDERMKDFVGKLEEATSALKLLTPEFFRWKKDTKLSSIEKNLGFSAQKVMNVMPEGVAFNKGESWSISDRGLIAYLVKGFQELETRITQLSV